MNSRTFRTLYRLALLPVLAFGALGSLGSLGSLAHGQDDETNAAALRTYFSANGLLNRGLYEMAAAEYADFLERYPDHEKMPVARYGLGVSRFRIEHYGEAIDALAPLRDTPRFPFAAEVAVILGQCHMSRGEYDAAALRFQDVLGDHPDHELADDAASLQAEAYHLAGHHQRVPDPCRLLITRWPDSPHAERAELFWGLSEMAGGDFPAAAERFDGMHVRYPDGVYADHTTLLLAQSLHRANAPQRAIDEYRNVVRQAHDTYVPEALYGLSIVLHQQGRVRPAGEMLDELVERFPDHDVVPAARLLRGRVWFDLERYDEGIELFALVEKEQDEYADDAAYWAAKCDIRRGEPGSAATRLGTAIERYPKSALMPEMIYDRAVALLRTDRTKEGLQHLERFRSRYPRHVLDPEALHLIASTQHRLEEYEESLASCVEHQRSYPEHALASSVTFLAAENQFLLGDHSAAAQSYRRYLNQHPDDEHADEANFRLGMALYHLGSFGEAKPYLTQTTGGASVDPAFRPAFLALGDLHFQNEQWDDAGQHLANYLSFGVEQPASDDALLKLGISHQRRGDHESALAAYETLLEGFPRSEHRPHATFESGQTLLALDRGDEAEAAFTEVVRGDDDRFTIHALNHLGSLAIADDRLEEAAEHFGAVAERANDDATATAALGRRGEVQMADNSFRDAEATFTELIQRYPKSNGIAGVKTQRAIALARQAKHDEALDAIQDASRHADELDGELRVSLAYEKAWCLRALDRDDEAADAYRALLEEPTRTDLSLHALLELADLEAEAGEHGEAADRLRRLLEETDAKDGDVGELREQARYRLGVCEYSQDRYAHAAAEFATFIDAHPDSELLTSASVLCGEALFKSGEHRRAIEHLERVTKSRDADDDARGPALLRLGECHAALQQWPESEQAYTQYLKRYKTSELAYQARFGLGWAQENQGRRGKATTAYRQVVNRHEGPTAARAQFQIGECLYADKRYDEAARELIKVDILYAYPEWSAAALYEAGRCFAELNDPVRARELFEQVRREHGSLRWAKLADLRLDELSRSGLPGHKRTNADSDDG